ncbi:hypothetical protein DFJ73DRAFT_400878 [Zopfochytrium polystomum]|nr:hypothetical protein DFJ73DRAFT_400878 [Zopfochytrium polystomum]
MAPRGDQTRQERKREEGTRERRLLRFAPPDRRNKRTIKQSRAREHPYPTTELTPLRCLLLLSSHALHLIFGRLTNGHQRRRHRAASDPRIDSNIDRIDGGGSYCGISSDRDHRAGSNGSGSGSSSRAMERHPTAKPVRAAMHREMGTATAVHNARERVGNVLPRSAGSSKSSPRNQTYTAKRRSTYNLDSARYVVPRILAGCKQLPQREVLVDRIGNSMYKVFAEVTWEDVDNPRSIESRVRVYSPFGNLRSADLDYDFYVRYSSIQSFSSLEVHLRDASHLSAKRPSRRRRTDDPCFHSITVFQQSHNRSRRDIRRLADPTEILGIAGHLLGFEADVSLIKCLKLLLSMATVGYHGDTSTSWILRCYMRENVGDLMAEGEETEDEELEEELDADSNQSWGSEQ